MVNGISPTATTEDWLFDCSMSVLPINGTQKTQRRNVRPRSGVQDSYSRDLVVLFHCTSELDVATVRRTLLSGTW